MKILKAYEVATTSKFTVLKQTKDFGGTRMTRNVKGIHVHVNVALNLSKIKVSLPARLSHKAAVMRVRTD